jgi:conjugal transfer pilus assembly protein TraI
LHAPIAADTEPRAARRIELLEQTANESTKAEFARKWLALAERCAAWFSSMPLGPELYREPGGAFRCTIETAFYAMRLAGGQKFGTNLPSEKRRRIEPQYNYGVFLAAICSRLDEPYRHFEIVRDADMQVWSPPVHGAVAPWLGASPYRWFAATRCPSSGCERGCSRSSSAASCLLGLDVEVLAEVFGAINPNQVRWTRNP